MDCVTLVADVIVLQWNIIHICDVLHRGGGLGVLPVVFLWFYLAEDGFKIYLLGLSKLTGEQGDKKWVEKSGEGDSE